jgi:hypothetical protein
MMSGAATLAFAPLIPWPLLAGLGALGLLLCGYALARRASGAWLRVGALAAGLLTLANPSLVEEQRDPLPDIAAIVVDASPSQEVGERKARTAEAVAELRRKLEGRPDLEVRVVEAGDSLGDGTRLVTAMQRALSDAPRERIAGAILVTDGQAHDAGDPERADPGAPVHVLLTGNRGERDRRLVIREAPRYGIVGDQLQLTILVDDLGDLAGRSARVTLGQDGRPVGEFSAPIGRSFTVPFQLRHGGPTVLELEVETAPDELTPRNNRAVLMVNGVRDRLRVLLVSGEPHAGERTWRNILKSDPSVDLVHFTILRPPEKQDGTPIRELSLISFPTRELFQTKLDEFDLIIFDRYRRRGVLPDIYLQNVAEYVEAGGAVLTASGPAFATPLSLYRTPLGRILPGRPTGEVVVQGFKPKLTEEGRRHPVTADLTGGETDDPAWGRWFRLVSVEPERGTTVLEGAEGKPVLLLDRVGEGRVAQLLSDHAWLWTRGFEGGGPQAELLRRVAHWLMKEPDLEEEDLRAEAEGGRLRIVRRSLSPQPVEVTVTMPSGATARVPLADEGHGRSGALLPISETGLYRLTDGTLSAVAAVGDLNPKEFADLRTSPQPLQPLVQRTGGGTFWLVDGQPDVRRVKPERDAAGRDWLGLRANGAYVVSGVTQIPLLPALLALALVLGVLMLAWRREGK